MSQTLENGWRRTLPAALAPLLSDGPIIALVLLVLSQVPEWLQRFLYIAGGVFVLYLAWGAYQQWRHFKPIEVPEAASESGRVWKAALINALSPGPYIYWSLVTGPIFMTGWRETPIHGVSFMAGFYGAMVSCLVGFILLFALARHLGSRITRALLGVSVVALTGFGIYQLWLGVWGGV